MAVEGTVTGVSIASIFVATWAVTLEPNSGMPVVAEGSSVALAVLPEKKNGDMRYMLVTER
jgi:hypothetical protein